MYVCKALRVRLRRFLPGLHDFPFCSHRPVSMEVWINRWCSVMSHLDRAKNCSVSLDPYTREITKPPLTFVVALCLHSLRYDLTYRFLSCANILLRLFLSPGFSFALSYILLLSYIFVCFHGCLTVVLGSWINSDSIELHVFRNNQKHEESSIFTRVKPTRSME